MAVPAALVGVGRALAMGGGAEGALAAANTNYAVKSALSETQSIIHRAIEGIKGAFTGLADQFTRVKNVILETTKAFAPYTVILFNRAILDLQATFGQIFLPIVKQAITFVRALADAIYNLPTGVKTFIRAVTEIILAISGTTAIFVGVVGAIAAVVTAVGGLAAGLYVLGIVAVLLAVPLTLLAVALFPLIVLFGSLAVGIGVAVIGLVQLIRMMLQTEGGVRLLKNIMRGFDQIVTTVQAGWSMIMSIIGPVIDGLYTALSELGDALSELFDALKPLIAAGLLAIISTLAVVLTILAKAVSFAVQVITFALNLLSKSPPFRALKAISDLMPEGEKKSSFGLGWSTARVDTDANAIYNRLTEELLRNTRMGAGEAEEDPAKKTAKSVDSFAGLLVQALTKWLEEKGDPRSIPKNFLFGAPGFFLD